VRRRIKAFSQFIDVAEIEVIAGDGGHGCVSFRREKFVPRGGPDGGTGGRGGDVILRADPHLSTLLDYKYKTIIKAERGMHGKGKNQQGRSGKPAILRVPPGTVVLDAQDGSMLCDMADKTEVIVARGGRGGRGNAAFATPTDRAPRTAEDGACGEKRRIILELKLIADIGLVGKPNVGKSTLIAKLTGARPKVGAYPFTTLRPHLGVLDYGDRTAVLADIPGLIEGAHSGKGLGHEFLRHIERTKALVCMLDASGGDHTAELKSLRRELALYDMNLADKPFLVVLNKADLLDESELKKLSRKAGPLPISAVTGYGLKELVGRVAGLLEDSTEDDVDGEVDEDGEGEKP
jgi:GTP-binding protein